MHLELKKETVCISNQKKELKSGSKMVRKTHKSESN
jgi:hypothetical protein